MNIHNYYVYLMTNEWRNVLYTGVTNSLENGTEDHIHLLAELPPALAVAEAAGKLRGSSSHWVNESFPDQEFA